MLTSYTNAPMSPREDLNLKPSAYQTDAQTKASSVASPFYCLLINAFTCAEVSR